MENEQADAYADRGYRTHQNPTQQEIAQAAQEHGDTVRPGKKPDYLIEGKVFDAYSPTENRSERNIASAVEKKIDAEQTQRVALNLTRWNGSVEALRDQFSHWPIANLKEVKGLTGNGDIIQIYP
ncbi:hypothetical protein [Catenuloplanes nepalensis]|nr:hypothetical protein [Catenuloplanes nepalensis]